MRNMLKHVRDNLLQWILRQMEGQTLEAFTFQDTGPLTDGKLQLVVTELCEGDPAANRVPAYKFKMTPVGDEQEIGHIDLRIGNTDHLVMCGGHIGYGVEPEHRGHHYAARAVRLLMPLARRHSMTTLWITCNPDNLASRRTCELAGAQFIEIVDLPEDTDMYLKGERQKCRYRLDL